MFSHDATESREYAGGTLKADPAAQPKGCSVCIVPRPQNQYRKLNRPTKWAHIKLRVQSGKCALFTDSKLYLRVPSGKCAVFTDRTYINLDFPLSLQMLISKQLQYIQQKRKLSLTTSAFVVAPSRIELLSKV